MWLQLAVGLLTGLTVIRGEIFDVTTIYDLDDDKFGSSTGHVHVRTNALGLPVSDGKDEALISDNLERFKLICDLSEFEKCSWDIGKNNSVSSAFFKEIVPGQEHKITHNLISVGLKIWNQNENGKHVFFCIGNQSETKQFILLDVYQSYSLLFINMYENCHYYDLNYYYSCQYSFQFKKNTTFSTVCCSQNTYSLSNKLVADDNDLISFNFKDGLFNLYHRQSLLKDIAVSSPELYSNIYFGDNTNIPNLVFVKPVLKTSNGTEMASPLLMLESMDQICLTLVLYCHEDSSQDVLHMLAKDPFNTDHFLQAISNLKVGWTVKQLHINITKEVVRPFKLLIRTLGNISLARISSCDLEGEEVWPIKPVEKHSLYNLYSKSEDEEWDLTLKYIYKANLQESGQGDDIEIKNGSFNNCQNGGVMTTDGCACPPGFTGTECQIGCGPNRFGLDCTGLCSMRTYMCKQLLLCNSITGCHCAPGYKQMNCSHQCDDGEYGNNCAQTCGHCLSGGACDIYTGECQACEPGYFPPYCKQAYVYHATKPELSSLEYGTITVKFNPNNIAGIGIPEIYQIQYRIKFTPDWNIFTSQSIKKNDEHEDEVVIEERIEGLMTGYVYEVRVVLIDANFNKYDGDLIQVSETLTKCDIPDTVNYNLTAESTSMAIKLSWSYKNESIHWCPLKNYEVSWKEGWKWLTIYTEKEYFTLDNLMPKSSIKFRVRAQTNGGYAPSSELMAYTQRQGSYKVRDLRVVDRHTTSVRIFWNPPKDSDGHLKYIITFKCVEQLACPPGCVNASEGSFTQDQTSVTLSPLLPFAQYYVTVAPEDGPKLDINIGTLKTEPTEVPSQSAKGSLRTNTSLTVFWEPVTVCSSFHLGYRYHLHKESDSTKILASGFTKTLNATFHDLVASTEYNVKVYVVTIAGWNSDAFLDIFTSTSATVPEAVRNLTVYKRTRNSLSLRWAAPRVSYGRLKSFTISYSLGAEEHSESLEPTFCVPWPHLYCHTLQGLWANRKYNVSVSAKNVEVAEEGAKTSVIGITKESPPSAPEGLKLTNSSSNSVTVEWHYPDLPNGIIRSFLISVEETEQFNQDDCCQEFPLVESPVQEELLSYKSEVSGLHSASTYFVSVSAKTVGLGPSQSLVVHTKPPHLPFSMLPQLEFHTKATWLPQEPQPQVFNNSKIFQPLIKAHILLLVEDTITVPRNESGIFNPQLNALLQNVIGKPFYFYTEYSKENQGVMLTTVPEMADSAWGTCPPPSILNLKDSYQLVAVQVSEYSSEFNVDLRYLSEAITLDD